MLANGYGEPCPVSNQSLNIWTHRIFYGSIKHGSRPLGLLPDTYAFAKELSFWGLPFIGLIPGLGLFLIGQKTSRLTIARFGLALLLASSTAGLTTNMLRNSLGRPRPMASSLMDSTVRRSSTSTTGALPVMPVLHSAQRRL